MKKLLRLFTSSLSVILLISGLIQAQAYFDVEPGEGDHVYSLLFDDPPECLSASPDGNTLLFGIKEGVYLVDFSSGKLTKYINYRNILRKQEEEANIGFVKSIATLGGGSKVAVAGLGGLLLLDVNSEKILWTAAGHPTDSVNKPHLPKTNVHRVEVTPDEKWLFTASLDEDSIRTWSTQDGEAGKVISTGLAHLQQIDISPDGKQVAALGDSGIAVFDLASGDLIWDIKEPGFQGALTFSPDGKYLAAATSLDDKSGVVLVDVQNPAQQITIENAGGMALNGLVWTRDSKSIYTATAGRDACPVKKWTLAGGQPKAKTIEEDFMVLMDADHGAVAGKGGTLIALAGDQDELRVYRLK